MFSTKSSTNNIGNTTNVIPTEHCNFCDKDTNHNTNTHKCKICNTRGHSAKEHCAQCKQRGHLITDHKCVRYGCNILTEHIHTCEYCLDTHKTEEHTCEVCKQIGHYSGNHFEKSYCDICKIHGHPNTVNHFDCDKCGYIIINKKHIWCDKCNTCTFDNFPHVGLCGYCDGCTIHYGVADDYGGYNDDEDALKRCVKCFKSPVDDEFDINVGIKVNKIKK
jgi:hypothetical protein